MKHLTLAIFTIAFVCVATAAENEAMLKRTGGRLMKPNSQKGVVTLVNAQKTADAAWINDAATYLTTATKVKTEVKPGTFDFAKVAVQGNFSIFIVDNAALPKLLTAPEDRWAMVNVAPIKSDKPAFFAARTKKEISRAFAMLCGGAGSQYKSPLLGAVTAPADLDQIMDNQIPVDVVQRMRHYLKPFGVEPGFETTYISACIHGWAPAPTNEVQKAVWDRAHELPKNPMKIEFDPKKGR